MTGRPGFPSTTTAQNAGSFGSRTGMRRDVMARRPPRLKVVHVIWIDSHSRQGWTHEGEFKEFMQNDCIINTVGFLIDQNKRWIAVSPTISVGTLADTMKIPKVAIIRMRQLTKLELAGFDE